MTSRSDIATAIRRWLKEIPGAADAADRILLKAESKGRVPAQITCPVAQHAALVTFFSDKYVRRGTTAPDQCKLLFSRWEAEVLGGEATFLPGLAAARGRPLRNRQRERQDRAACIQSELAPYASVNGLPGLVSQRELDLLDQRKGRFWHRSDPLQFDQMGLQIRRYMALLQFVEDLRSDSTRMERVVHASRLVAGDTHWLRPGNQVWRDLAEDELQFHPLPHESDDILGEKERATRALSLVGLVDNLTSVTVLVFGRFALLRPGARWNWATEAAEQHLPIWLSGQHLLDAHVVPDSPIRCVISIENETSFLDLMELHREDNETLLVYTEGHANRAVVALLRRIEQACPDAVFHHQGDLDLFGVRILASLIERTGLPIEPMCMDVETHQRFESAALPLTDHERDEMVQAARGQHLPCRELLRRISETGLRIEQEVITATLAQDP
ncbi:MAG: Wadjet anti-phage system protein JetD domain-containing protein [Pirellulaceae bacterium]